MSGKIIWDAVGARVYETGVKNGVLYPKTAGVYGAGVAWNGLISVTESPEGAEATPSYADDRKYLNMVSAEDFKATVEAYTYPVEFEACDGSATIAKGVTVGQQSRSEFGLCYRTAIGNDADGIDHGYKLHIIYGALAAPSEKGYQTQTESPEAITFSWELTTTPVEVPGFKPSASVVVDSTKTTLAKLQALEDILYGKDAVVDPAAEAIPARLPLPAEIITIIGTV